jgi:asparagine synthetase B (glutamine-hydrolysing)
LDKINGVFAFSFYDREKKMVWTARDNLGVKPLYYYHKDGKFAASSECKAFFQCSICTPKIRKELLGEYFANYWIYEPNTLFKDIYKLEAGCCLIFDMTQKTLLTKRYWSPAKRINFKPNLQDIIKLQTVTSDVKVSAYLSGGVDSSIIACALKDKNLTFLHLDLGGQENIRVKRLKDLYNLNIVTAQPKVEHLATYEYLIKQLEEPVADPAIIPSYELAREAKIMGSTVMLSGMGGDDSHNTIYSDKTSMAASVEARVPLLDKDLVNYFYKDIHLLRNNGKKRLKKELKKYIGKENYKVKKEGFRYPIREWLEKNINWKEVIEGLEELKLLNVNYVKTLIKRLREDKSKGIEMKLWAIYTLFLWIKAFDIKQ